MSLGSRIGALERRIPRVARECSNCGGPVPGTDPPVRVDMRPNAPEPAGPDLAYKVDRRCRACGLLVDEDGQAYPGAQSAYIWPRPYVLRLWDVPRNVSPLTGAKRG